MSGKGIPNLDPDQLDCFLGIVTDRTDSTFKSSDDQLMVDAVHKVLNSPLGKHSAFPDPLQNRLRHFTQVFSDKSLIDMVLDPKTEPVILKVISYCAQEYSFHVSTQAENAIAITIYYAATASLLVHHNKKILENSYENLIESFTDLMKKRWLVPELKQHIDRACKICQQKQESKKDEKRLSDEESLKYSNLLLQMDSASNDAASSLDIPVNEVGSWVGHYKLLRILGEGGMGIVYLAEQEKPIKRQVALKVIKPGMDSKRVIARFAAERQALALLDHPNIAHIHEAGTTDSGRPYFAMEYVEGIPITEHCDYYRLTIEDRLDLFLQVCHAIHHAHQKGIIHRDIKPTNILVSIQDDQVVPKIIDFGVAKAISQSLTDKTLLTEQGQVFGTPEYMSPEQADMANQDIDTRSDIYSLGVLLYVLLTGVLPFESEKLREGGIDYIRKVIREADTMTPSARLMKLGEAAKKIAESRQTKIETLARRLHRELECIPLKAMRKERARRYQSASELADDIENYLRGDPLTAGPESTTYRAMKMIRKHRVPFAAGVITVASLVAGLVISSAMYFRVEHARAEAQTVSDFLQNSVLSSLNLRNVKSKDITVRSVLDKISEDLGVEFQGQPLFEASIRQTLVSAYGVLGLYESAELHAKRAFEIHRTQLGTDNIATLYSRYQIGWVYMLQSRYSEAEPLLTEGLTRFKRALEKDHPIRLYCMAFLGLVYNFQDRFTEAEELLTVGLNVAQSARDTEHPVERFLIYSLALTYRMQGRYQEAERLYLRGLQISPQLHGEQDDDTLYLMHGLGALHWIMGRYDEAEETLQTVLEIRRELWGMEHPSTLHVMADLSGVYHDQGRYEEAESQFAGTLKSSLQVLGEDHLYSLSCMHGLGIVYLSQGRYDKAETILSNSLNTGNRIMGEANWVTLGVMNTLAKLYTKQERFEEAESLFTKAIVGRIHKLGEDHPDTLESKNDLAMLYKELARYEEAEKLLLEAIEGRRLKLGDTHPLTLESIKNLITLYESWNKPEKAKDWRAKLSQTGAVTE